MTKARLGEESDEPERLLTRNLVPVREVMEAGDLDFDQLLQRDLDDHRVAVKLIPYLLDRKATGPAFFPPIVAVLLPFRSKKPTEFPTLGGPEIVEEAGGQAKWLQERAGNAFQVDRLVGHDGQPHSANVGRLWWNQIESRLVVLDGQHRAMALLAVERTKTNGWQGSSGARYRSFYENQVKQVLQRVGDLDLAGIEVPVTVCWFPEETGERSNPHAAARKLFVDVNKEARPPSKSRIILLSDAELSNVLTRRVLNELRDDSSGTLLPIYAVEYDNPDANTTQPARWSVLTNIHLLKSAVDRCVFGPGKYLQKVDQKISGRTSLVEQDRFMAEEQLDLASVFPDQVKEGGFTYTWDEIGNRNFPLGHVDAISDRFAKTWGRALITLLSLTAPYAAHARALTQTKDEWHISDTSVTLAHDALFSGVGVFWTLRDSYEHYKERKQAQQPVTRTGVIDAWEALGARKESFESNRARAYLGSAKTADLEKANAAYAVFNTHACQLGMAMTLGSLWELRKQQPCGADLEQLPEFSEALVAAWNAYFALEHGKKKDRRLVFNKTDIPTPLNQIAKMDTPQAVYFRYFWMQILDTPEAWVHLEPWFNGPAAFQRTLGTARGLYYELLVEQQTAALKTSKAGQSEPQRKIEAQRTVAAALRYALKNWFYDSHEPFASWIQEYGENAKSVQTPAVVAAGVPAQSHLPLDSEGGDEALSGPGVADLLSE
ncbi:hypothetical protein [Kitasatospora sp. NPDC087271]|uniref:hypothetical protein n=1 Tax=Kitasatospora sp. NPDC087271 TaxID=3364067 RepID=UPI0037F92D4C